MADWNLNKESFELTPQTCYNLTKHFLAKNFRVQPPDWIAKTTMSGDRLIQKNVGRLPDEKEIKQMEKVFEAYDFKYSFERGEDNKVFVVVEGTKIKIPLI